MPLCVEATPEAVLFQAPAVPPTTPTVIVLPGSQKTQSQFRIDAAACQQQAQSLVEPMAQAANNQAASNVVIGTVIGAAAGALLGQGSYNPGAVAAWGAGTGMLVGSAAGKWPMPEVRRDTLVIHGELDEIAEAAIREDAAVPAFLGYHGYPATICASVVPAPRPRMYRR